MAWLPKKVHKRRVISLHSINTLIVSLALPFIAGGVSSIATASAIPTWYAQLNKPWFSPPNWLFAPVWTALYICMGISLYLIWSKQFDKKKQRFAVKVFLIHLVANVQWSLIFFGVRSPGLAFVTISILLGMIVLIIRLFSQINKYSAYLLIPYLCWVSFAAVLNFAIWWLN